MKRTLLISMLGILTFFSMSAFGETMKSDTAFSFRSDTIIIENYYRIRSEGKEFWMTFLLQDLWFESKRTTATMELLISSRYNANVKIKNPLTTFSVDTVVKQDSLLKIEIPIDEGMCKGHDIIENKAIYIEADTFISVYASNFAPNTFDATNVLPLQTLGNEYIIQTYRGEYDGAGCYTPGCHNSCYTCADSVMGTFNILDVLPPDSGNMAYEFYYYDTVKYYQDDILHDSICMVERVPANFAIVGIENNTNITITPSIDTYNGKYKQPVHKAGIPYSVTLNKGETYQVIGFGLDPLSGSHVKADKNIAVFNGNICSLVPPDNSACDHLVEQAMPIELWGDSFVVSIANYQQFNKVVLTAKNNNTLIWTDDTLRTSLNAFESYEFQLNNVDSAVFVRTSDSVACYQYLIGASANSSIIVEDTTCINRPEQPTIPLVPPEAPIQPTEPNRDDYTTDEEYNEAYNTWYNTEYNDWMQKYNEYQNVTLPQWYMDVYYPWIENEYQDWWWSEVYPWSKKYGGCNGNSDTKYISPGDPSMVWITPLNQRIPKITFATFDYNDKLSDIPYSCHFVNIVTPTASLDSMRLDGVNIKDDFQPVKNHPELSFNIRHLPIGTHTLENNDSTGGFTAHVYGIGSYESYAYNVGSLITKIIQEKQNVFAVIDWEIDTLCQTNSLLRLNYTAQSMIDSVHFYAAIDKTINEKVRFSTLPYSGSKTFTAHHVGTDTLFCNTYYHTFRSAGVGKQIKIDTVKTDTILFGAKLPATVIHQKWNDFIGVLTDNEDGMYSNGGHNFVEYQWYRNDTLLVGETNPYLYQDLIMGAEYSAMLTTADGLTSMTCPIIAEEKIDITPFPTVVTTAEVLRSPIVGDATLRIYNVAGQLIAVQQLSESQPYFTAPGMQGNYIVQFTTTDGYKRTYKMIVK